MNLPNTWTWADIVQLVAGFILFVLGIWIGKNQEKSVNLIKNLTEELNFFKLDYPKWKCMKKLA
jgi:hypothetical protein